MHKLVIQDDEGKTTVVPVIKDEITVGRKEGNTIRLTERNVSRRHARILRKNGTVELEDLNSYNGVRVNGSRIQGRIGLNPSDRVQIGDYVIELRAEGTNVNADPYEEQKTQPIERVGSPPPGQLTAQSLVSIPGQAAPVIQGPAGSAVNLAAVPTAADDAPTTKMPNMTFPGLQTGGSGIAHDPLADTDPARQAAQTPAPAPEPIVPPEGACGRLVILSSSFAGREYELTRPSMVIGRTEDNDVVVNHRSISRHHAKVVRENGRYVIVDLQSSNGVRVNGEEYGKVELRRGDVIDLGHVRLRFVEPGEDFVFGRDAQAVPIPTGGNRTMLYAVIAVVVLLGVGIFALTRDGDDAEGTDPTGDNGDPPGEQVASEQGSEPDPGTETDPGTEPNDAKQPNVEDIAPLLDKAYAAITKNKWDEAIAAAKEADSKDPGNETAKMHLQTAEREKANQERANQFNKAASRNQLEEAMSHFEAIEEDSVYWRSAREALDKLAAKDEQKKLALVRRVKPPRCGDITQQRQAYEELWKKPSEQLQAVEKSCRSAQPRRVVRTQPTGPTETGDTTDTTDTTESRPGKSAEQLKEEMDNAFAVGQYGVAFRRCRELYKKKRSSEVAMRCAMAACRSNRGKDARPYYNALSGQLKADVYRLCATNGVTLP